LEEKRRERLSFIVARRADGGRQAGFQDCERDISDNGRTSNDDEGRSFYKGGARWEEDIPRENSGKEEKKEERRQVPQQAIGEWKIHPSTRLPMGALRRTGSGKGREGAVRSEVGGRGGKKKKKNIIRKCG